MEEKFLKFSSRVNLLCRLSDPGQPTHFLSRIYGLIKSKYHLHCDTCNLDVHKHCYLQPRCGLSELTKPHTLRLQDQKNFYCHRCKRDTYGFHYHCDTCNVDFHMGCYQYLSEITHPFHPLHPLKFTFSSPYHSYSDLHCSIYLPYSCRQSDSDTETDTSEDASSISDAKCKCCQKHLEEVYYHCSICNFILNLICTKTSPPFTILHLKSHEHTLTLFPRRIPFPCDACGLSLDNTYDHVYTCHLCNYMVHRTCIYLPRVIKITRHPHRLSFSSSLPSSLFSCGVCRHTINVTCGQFSCHNGCDYAVHSKCAVRGRVWDGKDLEGVPEEPDEDLESFVRIDDKTIQHFSHKHNLRLQKKNVDNEIFGENRLCQACIIPILISDESCYSCMQCDFLLHIACACLPRKKDHPLHKHPLILHPILIEPENNPWLTQKRLHHEHFIQGMFKCNGCDQRSYGFVYKCSEKGCKFQLDIRCASLPDPVIHGSHAHDLFFNLTQGECIRCKSSHCSPFSLECMECKSFLGLKCASFPSVMHYKHDTHPLMLCYGEEDTTNSQYWCEICEAKLDAKEWFYKCEDYCNVTIHINCLLGKEIFMKPMTLVTSIDGWVSVLRNSANTREICDMCNRRSTQPFYLQTARHTYCSLPCLLGDFKYL